MYYINYFFAFSIIGHFIESFFYSSGDSGILFGYWTPIYGVGTIIILFINNIINKLKISNLWKAVLLFFCCAVILAISEVIGGYLLKWIYNKELWDYSNHILNIGKYTSIEMSLLWGLSSILLIYFFKPFFDKIISKIPNYLTYIFIILFTIDLTLTIIIKS